MNDNPVVEVALRRAEAMLALYNRESNAFGISSAIADLLHLATFNGVSQHTVLNDATDYVAYESLADSEIE
jgi:hypothetical protein